MNLTLRVSPEQYTALVRLAEWKYAGRPLDATPERLLERANEFRAVAALVPQHWEAMPELARYRPVYRGERQEPCSVWVEWSSVFRVSPKRPGLYPLRIRVVEA